MVIKSESFSIRQEEQSKMEREIILAELVKAEKSSFTDLTIEEIRLGVKSKLKEDGLL